MHRYISKTTRYLTNCLRRSQRDAKPELVEDKVKEFEPINTNIKEFELPNINDNVKEFEPINTNIKEFELPDINDNVKEFEPINTNIKELELPNINGENTLPTDNIVNDFELQQVNNNDF